MPWRRVAFAAVALTAVPLATLACRESPDEPPARTLLATPPPSVAATFAPASAAVPMEAFADAVCRAWRPYHDEVQRLETVYAGIDRDDAPALKRALLEQLRRNEAAATELNRAATALPRPDVPGGEAIRQEFLQEFARQLERARSTLLAVEGVSDASAAALREGLERISMGENQLEEHLRQLAATYPQAQAAIDTIDARPDDCAAIFIQ